MLKKSYEKLSGNFQAMLQFLMQGLVLANTHGG
jgi:hypothetical protein